MLTSIKLVKTKVTLFVIFSLLSVTLTYAQQLRSNATVKAKHLIYKTDSLKHGGMAVYNDKNIYRNKRHKAGPDYSDNLIKSDKTSTLNAFKKVFSNDRLQQLAAEYVVVEYDIADDGRILELSFVLKQNTIITASEMEALETAIKNDVSFKWRGQHKPGDDFYVLTQVIPLKRILDGTIPQ